MKELDAVKVATPEPNPGRSDGNFQIKKGAVGSVVIFVAVTAVWP
jgi:hypothetical protein